MKTLNKHSLFNLAEIIPIQDNLTVHYQLVLDHLYPLITQERQKRFDQVIDARTFQIATVVEGLYDRGNVSAVMRSAEAFGFAPFHIIESLEKFKNANRVTRGAEKWLESKKWKTSSEAIAYLKNEGRKLIVTSLDANVAIDDIDFSEPVALVLGNEKEGVSKEMLESADYRIKLPMYGFVQSFNISVAAALGLYHISQQRKAKGIRSELSESQKNILRAHYTLRTLDSGHAQLRELLARKETSFNC